MIFSLMLYGFWLPMTESSPWNALHYWLKQIVCEYIPSSDCTQSQD